MEWGLRSCPVQDHRTCWFCEGPHHTDREKLGYILQVWGDLPRSPWTHDGWQRGRLVTAGAGTVGLVGAQSCGALTENGRCCFLCTALSLWTALAPGLQRLSFSWHFSFHLFSLYPLLSIYQAVEVFLIKFSYSFKSYLAAFCALLRTITSKSSKS